MREVHRKDVQRLIDEGAQVVEALPAEEFAEDHLPGAVNLTLRRIETHAVRELDRHRPVVVYCWDSA